jgi:hypothetical protein
MNFSNSPIQGHLKNSLQMPVFSDGGQPAEIFAIVHDESGSVYYSDELNHRVVAMNANGAVRWIQGAGHAKFEPFRYPRGICIGRILHNGSPLASIAVCDSWHHRLVFLDLEGNVVASWGTAGDSPFNEVSDVRFISSGKPSKGYWLVLDRGNHSLFCLGIDGQVLSRAGRQLPSTLTHLWQPSNGSLDPNRKRAVPSMLPFDPLFYPMHIFGDTEEAIFISEPACGELKQFLAGNLFPVHVQSPASRWLSAGSWGLLGWCPEDHLFRQYDIEGNILSETPIEGTAIPGHGASPLVWTQSGNKLTSYEFDTALNTNNRRRYSLLHRTTEYQLIRFADQMADSYSDRFFSYCESYLCLTDEVLHLYKSGNASEDSLSEIFASVHALDLERTHVFSDLARTLFDYRLGLCVLQLLIEHGLPLPELSQDIRQVMALVHRPFIKAFPRLANYRDELFMAHSSIQALSAQDRRRRIEPLIGTLHQIVDDFLQQVYCCARMHPGNLFSDFPEFVVTQNHAKPLLHGIDLPAHHQSVNIPHFLSLKEVKRVSLNIHGNPISRPYGLARSPEGHFYASLFGAGTIVRFDLDGHSLEIIITPPLLERPAGIDFDSNGNLWIVDSMRNEILIWDPTNGDIHTLNAIPADNKPLASPVGICRTSDGAMLLADTGNHRILHISCNGACRIFKSGEGTLPGEFRLPNSLCSEYPANSYWILDHRNHRLQQLDASGNFKSQIGACGLAKAGLYLPESVVQLDDGTLVVSQGHFNPCLKFFSQNGDEIGQLALDYAPGGMLPCGNKLLVAQFDSSFVCVYERNP